MIRSDLHLLILYARISCSAVSLKHCSESDGVNRLSEIHPEIIYRSLMNNELYLKTVTQASSYKEGEKPDIPRIWINSDLSNPLKRHFAQFFPLAES